MKARAWADAAFALLLASSPVPGHGAAAADANPFSIFEKARYRQVDGDGGVPINVVEMGDPARPAILLIHGYRQSHLSWVAQFASDLPSRCHLVAFDLRGHGDSGAPFTSEAYASSGPWGRDVAAVIAATGIVRPLIVAWSFGGNVAIDYLRETPDASIAGLVLVGTAAMLPPSGYRLVPSPMPSLAQRVANAQPSTDFILGDGVPSVSRERFAMVSMRAGPFVDRGVLARISGPGNADLLPRVSRLPVTLVFGEDDPVIPPAAAANLEAALPAARVERFAHAKHAPFLNDVVRFDALLDELQCSRER